MANNPHPFATPLDKACCAEPLWCCAGTACAFLPCPACFLRTKTLETYGNGIGDFICCQGYFPACCCLNPADCCPGSNVGLFCEACLFPVLSVSIARIYVMDKKGLRPDPIDYQIIQCSNCLQLASCLCHVAAIFAPELRDAAAILDCIADTFTAMVNGCMCAQIMHEMKVSGGARVTPQPIPSAPQPMTMAHHPQPGAPVVAVAVPQARTFAVAVPPGTSPGTALQVQSPDGVMMMVQVPPGTMPGTQIMVQY